MWISPIEPTLGEHRILVKDRSARGRVNSSAPRRVSMFRRLAVLMLITSAPLSAAAANREMQELQRDVAQLQDLVKALTAAVNEKFTALQTQVQGSAEAA